VCGKIAECGEPAERYVEPTTCEHLLFTYFWEDDRFNRVLPSCEEITDKALEAREEYGIDAFAYAVERLNSTTVLCFSTRIDAIVYSYAFDFEPKKAYDFEPEQG
jgi:hypothetical protein